MICTNIIESIGNTPLVQLNPIQGKGNVFAKMELMNPFGMKDRVAKQIILEAKRTGELKEGAPIIESSSGTMACGVAMVGACLGHQVHIVTDPRIDSITLAKLTSLGCNIEIVERMGTNGWQSARLQRLHEMMDRLPGAYWPRQYENPNNPVAYSALAEEVMSGLGHVDFLIAAVGSGGSMTGTARALKRYNPNLKVIAVDCTGSVIFGQPDRSGRLQGGLGNSIIAPNVDHSLVDEVHWLNDEEAFAATLALAREQQIFAGNSSGSVYVVARWLQSCVPQHTNILAIFPDRGDRYVDTIYSHQYRVVKQIDGLVLPEEPQLVPYRTVVHSWSYARLEGVAQRV
ncbi:PLP-dependent cysteine synthase family protein [Paenibacillus sp. SYP-B4298]|uniref:PLP-dependent cysteine synthase family protein n=1 Tax=Paenibacillus sp. SYP-B4298 TaxID=2996034 RepID=UPI0022DE1837|nr:cysteine synthase family protein [Paenibacillus sp. SYP-B4298]